MKANELRIGNLNIWDGEIQEVDASQLCSMQYGNLGAEPIPLTEEWLVKFGFEFDIFYQKLTNGKICIYWLEEIRTLSYCKSHRENVLRYNYPKYVHSLQNLYFALTSEELTIKQ